MLTLSLDLAGKTGYGVLYDTGEIKLGTWNLVRGDLGGSRSPIPMVRLWKRLIKFGWDCEIEHIILEEAFGRGAAKYRLDSLQHATILYAMNHGISWSRVNPSQWKSTILGKGRATREEYLKLSRERWPEDDIKTDDEAVARCLLAYSQGEKLR